VVPFLLSPLSVVHDAPIAARHPPWRWRPLNDGRRAFCLLLADAERMAGPPTPRTNDGSKAGGSTPATSPSNTGVMLFLGLGYHHWTSGIINGVFGRRGSVRPIIFTQNRRAPSTTGRRIGAGSCPPGTPAASPAGWCGLCSIARRSRTPIAVLPNSSSFVVHSSSPSGQWAKTTHVIGGDHVRAGGKAMDSQQGAGRPAGFLCSHF